MKLRLFVVVYGDAFLDLYEKVCIRSLRQPLNAAALKALGDDVTISLYSDEASIMRATYISSAIALKGKPHLIDTSNPYDAQAEALRQELAICVKEDAALVMICPDNFWGDGSLPNLLDIAGEQDAVCVAAPHVRVDRDKFLRNLDTSVLPSLGNDMLVSWSMASLHPSWISANANKSENNTFYTGISIRHCGDLHYVTHLQPTIWYAKPSARDYAFFMENKELRGIWDHFLPDIVAREGRLRVVGSSDAVFIAELTPADSHNTPVKPVDPRHPDVFHRHAGHIALNRGIVSVWRE